MLRHVSKPVVFLRTSPEESEPRRTKLAGAGKVQKPAIVDSVWRTGNRSDLRRQSPRPWARIPLT